MITNPKAAPENLQCALWVDSLLGKGFEVKVPEIIDYEIRRELLRGDKIKGIRRLDEFIEYVGYIPLTTETMLMAAEFWAQVRKQGKSTADDKALDGDVILAAQAAIVKSRGNKVVVATMNVGHLSRLIEAEDWKDIQ